MPAKSSILCENCCRNQQLKIKQLSNFVPHDEAHYNAEVEAYARRLEEVYRLCRLCDVAVSHELYSQDQHIKSIQQTSATSSQLYRRDISAILSYEAQLCDVPWYTRLLYFGCVIISFGTLCSVINMTVKQVFDIVFMSSSPAVPLSVDQVLVIGCFMQLLAAFASINRSRLDLLDVLTCFSWLLNMILVWALLDSHVFASHWLVVRWLFALCTAVLAMACLVAKLRCTGRPSHMQGISRNPEVSLKKEHSVVSSLGGDTQDSGLPDDMMLSDEVPCMDQMRMMRLGTPCPLKRNKRGMFSVTRLGKDTDLVTDKRQTSKEAMLQHLGSSPNDEAVTSATAQVSTVHKRPVLLPARFRPASSEHSPQPGKGVTCPTNQCPTSAANNHIYLPVQRNELTLSK
jgi:hypothetical protein